LNAATTALLIHAGLAAVWDLAERRIPNWLIVSGLLFGFAFSAQSRGFAGLGFAFLGALVALVVLIGPFALRWMGGGDVKIAMVCGAFTGWNGTLHIILIGTVVHGLLGILVLGNRAVRRAMGQQLGKPQPLPHAVGFGIAAMLYVAGVAHFF
jgi:prepilin peptidase CpaA